MKPIKRERKNQLKRNLCNDSLSNCLLLCWVMLLLCNRLTVSWWIEGGNRMHGTDMSENCIRGELMVLKMGVWISLWLWVKHRWWWGSLTEVSLGIVETYTMVIWGFQAEFVGVWEWGGNMVVGGGSLEA